MKSYLTLFKISGYLALNKNNLKVEELYSKKKTILNPRYKFR